MASRSNVTGTENKREKKKEKRKWEWERKRDAGRNFARTEIVSFREWEACISLRGCALDNGIWGALSSSFRLLTK